MKRNLLFSFFAVLTLALAMSSCEEEIREIVISDDKQIDELMEEQKLTAFLSILDISGMRSTIHAYGNYALFAPTNEAVSAYLQGTGKASVNDLTKDEAAAIIKYHLLHVTENGDSLATTTFVDGRMSYPTFTGTYLTTKQEGENIRINRQALILSPRDIRASNGYLHLIDRVLIPPDPVTESIAARIENLPDDFSIMKNVFRQSGMAEVLAQNDINTGNATQQPCTFFFQDDEAFADAGIHSMEDLIADLKKNTPNIENEDTLLYNYVSYHTVPGLYYVADLLVVSSLNTKVKNQVITFTREFADTETKILLNEIKLGQTTEPGVELDRNSEYTDWTCANGVIHRIKGNIQIKIRSAYRIYWDIAEQPEIMALRNFRKPGCKVDFNVGDLSEIQWEFKSGCPTEQQQIHYQCGSIPSNINAFVANTQYIYNDFLRLNLDLGAIKWMEMKTPVLIGSDEGVSYKIWICYRREMECNVKTTFKQENDDPNKASQILPIITDMSKYAPSTCRDNPEQAEQDGYKQYTAKRWDAVVIGQLLGTIKVYSTGRHTLRMEPTTSRRVQQLGNIDMIQFIPVDENQLWPRVDMKGSWIGSDVKVCEILPYEECPEEPAE
jgi:uncharacterized surface protein with fasciclin (FAS1) repeats